ncbi:conserved protein of unknown function [Candidatus Hydrogenisulfobacillus filiaventi]|uniref:DUF2249 domain-containing protein n=1 Tax=Candidatus Hydrogenisulfobacillus filiaventi TaxID=2707344 RepID=A0A6F8ZET8_9FIRM|nr:DUF2249 domain-containing protein [Bacillota bacterium]CAB1128180.1 conserved protein of unknown function [Candidatus Hydrogenisulfobacillus filiaventi]
MSAAEPPVLDNRGLEPPQPFMRTLEVLDGWGPGPHRLTIINDREPLFLYPELEERGLRWTVDARPEGVYITIYTPD